VSWLSRRRRRVSPGSDAKTATLPQPSREALPAALRLLQHGEPLPDTLQGWLETTLSMAAAAAGGAAPAADPRTLRVRLDGMPDWWAASGNVLLAAADSAPIVPEPAFVFERPTNCLVVLGSRVKLHRLVCMGEGGLVAVGEGANLWGVSLSIIGPTTIMIGEKTTATFDASLDARNGGSILVGADGMWGAGIRIITDDMHAIRDRATGQRINPMGGRIVIEPHVWLAEQVRIIGGCRIGEGGVVGTGSLVTGRDLPAHSVSVGRPARPVRDNIVWSREDAP